MDELQKHIDAFEVYFKSKQEGNDTTTAILTVESQCTVSERTVWRWHKEFDWEGREAIRASEINKEVQKRTDSSIIDNKTKYLTFYHKLLDKLKKNGFDIEIKSPRDLDLVIKGALLLQGEPTEHTQNTGKTEVDVNIDPADELNRIMDNALKEVDQIEEEK